MNNWENGCFFNSVIQILCLLPMLTDNIKHLQPSMEGVAMKIRSLFEEIRTSNEPVRTSYYVRYLNLLGYEPEIQCGPYECLLHNH